MEKNFEEYIKRVELYHRIQDDDELEFYRHQHTQFWLYQEDMNYLEPLSKWRDILLHFEDYRKELYDNLCIIEPKPNQITVFTVPSFDPENFLIIDKQEDIFRVNYRIFESSLYLWLAEKRNIKDIKVKEYEVEIDKKLGNKLFRLFEKEVKKARHPQAKMGWLDGVVYYISMYIGETLHQVIKPCPDSDSTLAILFNQIDELKEFVST